MSEVETIEKPEAGTSIAVIVESNPAIVLLDAKSKDDLFNHIRSEIEAFKPDLSTAKGRDAIKSFAFKITRTKTAVDDAGKKLTEEWRTKTSAVNEARREAKEELSAMADAVRKPLTDWEEAEKLRVDQCRETIQRLKAAMNVYIEDTSETVRARGKEIYEIALDPERFGDMLAEAEDAKSTTVASLRAALTRLEKEEADKAELARLQKAEADRLAKEAEEKAAEEQRQREQQQAAEKDRQRVDYAKAIIQHIRDCGNGMIGGKTYPFPILIHELEAKVVIDESFGDLEAEARQVLAENLEKLNEAFKRHMAKADEEHAAQVKRDAEIEAAKIADRKAAEKQAAHEAERAEEQRKHDEALAAERDRVAALERENAKRKQAEIALREETERRQKDVEHRANVKNGARDALIDTGASNALATKIVLAILAGDIPAVRLEF